MKRFFYIIITLIILISVPMYAASRFLMPEWLADKIESSLPQNSKLNIGHVHSKADLSIIYENIEFLQTDFRVFIPELIVTPNLNLKNPLHVNANRINIQLNENTVELIGSEIKVFSGQKKFDNFQLNGKVSSLTSSPDLLAQNVEFLMLGLFSEDRELVVSSEKALFKLNVPLGEVDIKLGSVVTDFSLNKEFKSKMKAEVMEMDLGGLYSKQQEQILDAKNIEVDLKFFKQREWLLPINFRAYDIHHKKEKMFSALELSAVGRWEFNSRDCILSDIRNNSKDCGKLIDVLNMNLALLDDYGEIVFKGNGFCVAPKSGCPQRIDATVLGKSTADIFSKIMRSGMVNPLVGGILLGSMLSSPEKNDSNYDHSIDLSVKGAQIYINGNPLVK